MKGISLTNFLLGVWLFFAPFALPFSLTSYETRAVFYQHFVLGFLIAAFALWRAIEETEKSHLTQVSWIVAGLGVLTIIAPFGLKFSPVTANLLGWNDMIVGVLVTALATYNALQTHYAFPMHREQH